MNASHQIRLFTIFVIIAGLLSTPLPSSALPLITTLYVDSDRTLSYFFEQLQLGMSLKTNGDGDIWIKTMIINMSSEPFEQFTWSFKGFTENDYTDVQIWTENTSSMPSIKSYQDDTMTVTICPTIPIYYRGGLHFTMRLSIKNLAQYSDNTYKAVINFNSHAITVSTLSAETWLPPNVTDVQINPPPSYLSGPYPIWGTMMTGPDYSFSWEVSFTPTNQAKIPIFKQSHWFWGDYRYGGMDDYADHISKWGSMITAASMEINFYAQKQGLPVRIYPSDLNEWLSDNGGYILGLPVLEKIVEYAQHLGVQFFLSGIFPPDGAMLTSLLNQGYPVILGVSGAACIYNEVCPTHYVVAKEAMDNGQDYLAVDPAQGIELPASFYGQIQSLIFFSDTGSSEETLQFWVDGPAELLVTDPEGKKEGYDPPTFRVWNDIPDAYYMHWSIRADGNPSQPGPYLTATTMSIPKRLFGNYTIAMWGTGPGTATLRGVLVRPVNQSQIITSIRNTSAGNLNIFIVVSDMDKISFKCIFLPIIRSFPH